MLLGETYSVNSIHFPFCRQTSMMEWDGISWCSHSFETSRHFSLFRSNPCHNVTVYKFCQHSFVINFKSLKFGGFLATLDCHVSKHNTLSPIYSLLLRSLSNNSFANMGPSGFVLIFAFYFVTVRELTNWPIVICCEIQQLFCKMISKAFCRWFCKIHYFFLSCTDVVFQNTISSLII